MITESNNFLINIKFYSFYDMKRLLFMNIVGILLITCCSPPGRARNPLS